MEIEYQFFSFLAVMEPDIDDRNNETEYDFREEVPKQTNLKVYFSKDYSNVFHDWKAVNVFYYRSFSKIPCYHSEILLQIL